MPNNYYLAIKSFLGGVLEISKSLDFLFQKASGSLFQGFIKWGAGYDSA